MPSPFFARFQEFASSHQLFRKGDRILAAVSGGVDSMVMLHLLKEAGVLAGVAHVNYALRGSDSDKDMELVEETAKKFSVPFHLLKLDPGWEKNRTDSIQMDARAIRYKWFNEILDHQGLDNCATAHHMDDQAETILLQVIKGMPFTGFMGIAEQHDRVIRPLLFASRLEIEEFAREHQVTWREDVSNETDAYQRNIIRHHIMPVVKQVNPSFINSIEAGKIKASGAFELFRRQLELLRKEFLLEHEDNSFRIPLVPLRAYKFPGSVLFHLIEDFGFHISICTTIFQSPAPQSGTAFMSATHQLVIDRDQIFIFPKSKHVNQPLSVLIHGSGTYSGGAKQMTLTACDPVLPVHSSEKVAFLDADALQFPLEWRGWQAGDEFIPLGMTGHKKVSDLLIDEKIPVFEKKQVTVLVSDNRIVWVVGIRISQEFCLRPKTKRAWKLEYQN